VPTIIESTIKIKAGGKNYSTAISKRFRSVLALHRPGENPTEVKNPKSGKRISHGGKTQMKTSYTYTSMTPL